MGSRYERMTQMSLYIAIGLTVFLCFSLLIMVVLLRPSAEARRLYGTVTNNPQNRRIFPKFEMFSEDLLVVTRSIRSKFGINTNNKLKERFLVAGFRDPSAADFFFAAQCVTPLIGIFA